MVFQKLPIELVYTNVLPKLYWNDLLCARSVCKDAKLIIDSYIRGNGGIPNTVEIKIRETGYGTFSDFLDLNFSASRFYLCNSVNYDTAYLFQDTDASKFLEKHGNQVTHLTVQKLCTNPSAAQSAFYDALPNLQALTIVIIGKYDNFPRISQVLARRLDFHRWFTRESVELPKCFKNLQVLNVSQMDTPYPHVSQTRILSFNEAVLKTCDNLIHFKIPVLPYKGDSDDDLRRTSQFIRMTLLDLQLHVTRRQRNNLTPGFSNLKFVDLDNYGSNLDNKILTNISQEFLNLCQTFRACNVQVQNLPAKILTAFDPMIHDREAISNVILSMNGLNRVALGMELNALEHLKISTMVNVSFKGARPPYHVTWPALKSLSVTIMSTKADRISINRSSISTVELFDVLFGNDVSRTSLNLLGLYFNSRMMDTFSKNLATFPCLHVEDIVSSCPKVTTLIIIGWPGEDNINFAKLWKGLKFLKCVTLFSCKLLSDEGFIGEDETKPAFLDMKHLTQVKLFGLHKMPLITDRVFTVVFKHLTVTSFFMQSDRPLNHITKEGILSLLSGKFATSVQYFSFDEWSLDGVNDLEFAILKSRFRSESKVQ